MHPVASLGRAEMREAGPCHEDMRGILVIDRRQNAPFLQRGDEIDRPADPPISDELAQRNALGDRLARELERRARALDSPAFAARGDGERPLAVLVDELRQSHERAPTLQLVPMRSLDQREYARIGEIIRRDRRACAKQNSGVQSRRQPDDGKTRRRGGANARGGILECDRARCEGSRELQALQVGQRVGFGARQLRPDDDDREAKFEPERGKHFFRVGARRVRDHRALKSAPIGEVEQRDGAGDRLDVDDIGAIGGLLVVEDGAPLLSRQMREKHPPDQLVRSAVDVSFVGRLVHRDPVGCEHALERGQMLCVAIDERPVEVEKERGAARHMVAPICQGVNSASP